MDSDEGKLFIGGISWETDEIKLKEYFQVYGDVKETVIMKDRATGRARGFGFVVFTDPSVADRALLDKHTIDGRMVEAKKAVPRDEQQNLSRNNISGVPVQGGQTKTKKIFVGGLASNVTEQDFRNYFEQFGTITDVVVMYDHTTQRPRGFGFITFDTEEAVDNVLQKNFHELKEKLVEVKRAVPKDGSTSRGGGDSVFSGPGAGRGGGGYGQGYSSPGAYGTRPDSRYGPGSAGRGIYPGYVGGSYATPGYGPSGGYAAMNGTGYGAGSGSGYVGSYAPGPSAGYTGGSAGSAAYVSPPAGGRSAWTGGGPGYANATNAGGYAGTAAGSYGSGLWNPGGTAAGQPTSGAVSYGGYGYAGSDNGYGSGGAYRSTGYGSGYGIAGAAPTGSYSGSYGDGYRGSGYQEGTWRAGSADGAPPGSAAGYDAAGYGGGTEGVANGPGNYSGSYGVSGRQLQRGPDVRFRPYPPPAAERAG